MPHNVMEVRSLRKEFGKSTAVQDVSFDVRKGEILGLLGANGAGKSTTLFMLLGLISPHRRHHPSLRQRSAKAQS